jgi:HSP20 family molecular chaperone IbpA
MTNLRRKSWMWAEACARLDEAERRHRHFFELMAAPAAAPVWEPPVNVLALGRELEITVALPGARAEDVVAQVSASGLVIEATVAPPVFASGMQVVRLEIPYGRMRRRIELPPGSFKLLEFRLDDGYLFVRLTGTSL